MILLDTHTWVWWLTKPENLSKRALSRIEKAQQSSSIGISVLSCLEVAMLVAKNRLAFTIEVETWIDQGLELPGVRLIELTPKLAVLSTRLPGQLPGDPVDRILAATAKSHACPLITKDQKLLDYPHIETIW